VEEVTLTAEQTKVGNRTRVERIADESHEQKPHSYVPDKSIAKRYVHRKVDGVEDFALMDYCMEKQINILFRGPTGSGKTMMPRAYAADRGLNYYAVPCDISLEPTSFLGRMMPTKEAGRFRWQDGPVTELCRRGGVLDFSEVNMAAQRVISALFPLLDERRELPLMQHEGEIVQAHEKLLIVADCNPGYRETRELNEAFLNRFGMKVPWGYSDVVEKSLIRLPRLLAAVKDIRDNPGVRTDVSTNSMMVFVQVALDLGYKRALNNFVDGFTPMERNAVLRSIEDGHSVELKSQLAALYNEQNPKRTEDVPKEKWDPSWNIRPSDTVSDFEWKRE
jgi:hypothetical protein